MRKLIFLLALILVLTGCDNLIKIEKIELPEGEKAQVNETFESLINDVRKEGPASASNEATADKQEESLSLPEWVSQALATMGSDDREYEEIRVCIYDDQIVYYTISRCCDMYNYIYDENKEPICAPTGGFDGQGDGKCSDFIESKPDCEILK